MSPPCFRSCLPRCRCSRRWAATSAPRASRCAPCFRPSRWGPGRLAARGRHRVEHQGRAGASRGPARIGVPLRRRALRRLHRRLRHRGDRLGGRTRAPPRHARRRAAVRPFRQCCAGGSSRPRRMALPQRAAVVFIPRATRQPAKRSRTWDPTTCPCAPANEPGRSCPTRTVPAAAPASLRPYAGTGR